MAMSLGTFRARFPEFQNAPDASISANLTSALLSINLDIWGSLADEGQAYLAAHQLALSPWGNAVRLVTKDGTTTYETHYKRLQATVSEGAMLL